MKTTRIRNRYQHPPRGFRPRAEDVLAVCDLADRLEKLILGIQVRPGVPREVRDWIAVQLAIIEEL